MIGAPIISAALRSSLLGLLTLGLLSAGLAQFPTRQNQPGNFGPPADAGSLDGSGFRPDSLSTDSLGEAPNIPPDARRVDRLALFQHAEEYLIPIEKRFEEALFISELEQVPGFVRHLGQIGKPYLAYRYGLEEDYLTLGLWRHPVFNRYDRWMLDPEHEALFMDTKTPYVDVDFSFGAQQLQQVNVDISRNFGAQWNVTAGIRRPQSVGVYRNFVTDHISPYAGVYYRTPDRRYQAFANMTFNRLNDQIHGGVPRTALPEQYPVVDGLIQDNISLYNQSFFKSRSAPMLDASLSRSQTSVYTDHFFELIPVSDTLERKHRLTLRGTAKLEWQSRRFFDPSIDVSRLESNLIPVLPTLALGTAALEDSFSVRTQRIEGSASYSWRLASGWQANLSGGLGYERNAIARDTLRVNQNITDQFAHLQLTFPGGRLEGDFQQRISTLLNAEQRLQASIDWGLPFGRPDSSARARGAENPWRLQGEVITGNLNPSLFQTYLAGEGSNAFQPIDSLRNEVLLHARAGIQWRQVAPIRNGDTLLPHYASLTGFWSNRQRPVLYTQQFEPYQPEGEGITRFGLMLDGRLRFLPHFFLETQTEFQQAFRSEDPVADLYARSLPSLRTRTLLYYDHRDLSIANMLRLGVGVNAWNRYAGQTLEPISGEFFPTNYEVPGYVAAEAFFQLNLHGVFVYARYLHLNEGILLGGYYTTPFYPMLERTWMLGVNWTFYD